MLLLGLLWFYEAFVEFLLPTHAKQQQRLVVLLSTVSFDLVHDQLAELWKWLRGVLPQQVLEAHKPELLILRVRHFRDSIRQHQKINRVGSS
jgi:hypothetical protein